MRQKLKSTYNLTCVPETYCADSVMSSIHFCIHFSFSFLNFKIVFASIKRKDIFPYVYKNKRELFMSKSLKKLIKL